MTWYVRTFLRSSLVWLGVGVVLGLAMAVVPGWAVYRAAHLHANLLGFVSMMIFGVAYHVVPRFAGRPLHRPSWAGLHVWLANGGLALLVVGFIARHQLPGPAPVALAAGGLLAAAGAFLFIGNIWVTLGDGAPPAFPSGPHPGPRHSRGSTP